MKIYNDKEMTKEVSNLDLGTAIAGQSKSYTFYIYNDLSVKVEDLEFSIENKEIVINNAPKSLIGKATDVLTVTWSPSLTVKKALKTELRIKGYELYSN